MLLRAKQEDAVSEACEVADIVLLSLFTQQATSAWVEPRADGDQARVTIERGQQVLAHGLFDADLADAVVARLALLCDLDPLGGGSQTGRSLVRMAGLTYEILVTVRLGTNGLGCEVRLLDEKGRDVRAVASQPGGHDYPAVLPTGTRVGPYRVLETIGHGGMGVVYLVEHKHLQKQFAMKVLLRDVFEQDRESATRFVCEARAAARVDHPGIVRVSDFGSLADGRAFLVMELVHGTSVAEILREGGAMDQRRALGLTLHAARALLAAHEAGVVHRDLTPSNIFVTRDRGVERVKLVDFGAAKMTSAEPVAEEEGRARVVFGTPYYMAPEHAQGHPTDPRSDIYSLGCCLFEMLTGEVPYHADSVRSILLMHILDPVPEPTSPFTPLLRCVTALTQRMIAKQSGDRYPDAGALAADIEVCLGAID